MGEFFARIMGSGDRGSSETSSEENDRQEQVKEDSSTATPMATSGAATSTKRFYECTFCKRGFTNAQALGGHMNMHRKDRAKDKKVMTGYSISPKPNEDYLNPNYMAPISSEPVTYYPVLAQRDCPPVYYFRAPGGYSSPRQQPHGTNRYHGIQRHQCLNMNEELWGASLSLQIGSSRLEDNTELNGEVSKGDELDLELRLGHDRY